MNHCADNGAIRQVDWFLLHPVQAVDENLPGQSILIHDDILSLTGPLNLFTLFLESPMPWAAYNSE